MLKSTSPETPYAIAFAAIAIASVKVNGGFTSKLLPGALASAALIFLASFSAGTQYAPLVRAFGILAALASISLAVRAYMGAPKKS